MPKNKKKRLYPAKKEQAALEYLVTYGWAILVVLVAIAGLAYFGVFSSDKFIPSKCILPPGISCLDFKVENDRVTGNGKITLRVQNSLGEDISINSIAAANCGTLTTSVNLLNGEATTLYVDCTAPISKSKYNEQINITYASMFSGITHILKGDLTSKVSGEIQQVNASQDTTPPTVSITAPVDLATVSGTTIVTATASDNVAVAGVQLRVDGINYGSEDTTAPYSISWDTTTATDGLHTLTSVARDSSSNTATSTAISVTVNNAAPDTLPPLRSNAQVNSLSNQTILSSTTTTATISLSTNENANCRYHTSASQPYSSMTLFSTTGALSHSYQVAVTAGNSYTRYIKCQDTATTPNANTDDYIVSFSVASGSQQPPTFLFFEGFENPLCCGGPGNGWYDTIAISRVASNLPGSTMAAEYHFLPGGTVPAGGSGSRRLFNGTDSLYLSYWVKYSSNWIGSGQPYHPHEFAFSTNEDDIWTGGAFANLTIYVEQNYVSGQGMVPVLGAQDGKNIDQSQVGIDLTSITENRAANGCNGNTDGYTTGCYWDGAEYNNGKTWKGPVVFTDAVGSGYKNNWHFVEAYYKLNSIQNGIGIADGYATYWFDGQLVMNKTNVLFRTGAHPNMFFNQIRVSPYIGVTGGSPADQTFWVDNLTVATGRLGAFSPPDAQAPSTPTGLTATAISSSQINLAWTASTDNVGIAGYNIYRCQGSVCTPTIQVATTTGTTYNDTSLTASTTYTYAVAAYDAAGNIGSQSVSASATTLSGFAAPDIYAWDFEGGTDTEASGNFLSGDLQPFIPNTPWERDTTVFKAGLQSVKQTYPKTRYEISQIQTGDPTTIVAPGVAASWSGTTAAAFVGITGNIPNLNTLTYTATKVNDDTITIPANTTQAGTGGTVGAPGQGNVGTAFLYNITPAQKNIYIAWWERKSPGWSSLDVRKILRFRRLTLSGSAVGSFLEGSSGSNYAFYWDHINVADYPNVNLPAPAPTDIIDGGWHHFEVHRDATDPMQARLEIWIDGVQYFNHVRDISGGTGFKDSGWLEIHSLFNSMRQQSTLNIDRFAISTNRIGVY